MSKTIQDCASMDAFERRERRRQKILGSSEVRIARILAGPNGSEQRKAPAVDGLNSMSESDNNVASGSPSNVDFVAPVYWENVGSQRLLLMVVLSFILHVGLKLQYFGNLIFVIVTSSLFYEIVFLLPGKLNKYPIHGYIVNMMLMAGVNERVVIAAGYLIDTTWNILLDLFVVMISFALIHFAYKTSNMVFPQTYF